MGRIKKYKMMPISKKFSEKGGFTAQFVGDGSIPTLIPRDLPAFSTPTTTFSPLQDDITVLNGAVYTASGAYHVIRGGCWRYAAGNCRSEYRDYGTPTNRINDFGFRVLCSAGLQ